MKTRTPRLFGMAAFAATVIGLALSARADVILPDPDYHWAFTNGANGTNSGNVATSPLTITNNSSGTVAFSNSGLDLTGNIGAQNTPQSKAGYASGALPGLGTLSKVTISFWVNTPVKKSGYQNIMIIGPSNGTLTGTDNVMYMRYDSSVGNDNNKFELFIGGSDTSGITTIQSEMTPSLNGEWHFFAISYDGTSSKVSNSSIQQTATGTLDNRGNANLQIYQGSYDLDDDLLRQGFYWGQGGVNWETNKGAMHFDSDTEIVLGSNIDFSRSLSGMLKDVRIYDDVLTAEQIGAIRAIPEPQAAALVLLSALCTAAISRRRRR